MVTVERAAEIIRTRGVVAYPTETAYALGVNALDKGLVKEVYDLKKRPADKKMPIIVDSLARLRGIAKVEPLGEYLSHHFHPGPLNIVVKSNLSWIGAFRISSSDKAHKLAELSEVPITATSANPGGKPPAYTLKEVKKYFKVPIVPGELEDSPVSTIYNPKSRKIIRKGKIKEKVLKKYVVAFDVLQKIKPDEREVKKIKKKVRDALRLVKKIHKNSLIGGSIAKETFLKGDTEADIFLIFPKSKKLDDQLGLLKEIARSLGETAEVSYAQHPYVKAEYGGMIIDLVPAYDTEPPEILSAADRSRWHVEYVSTFPEWMKDEVRLLKQFCRGIGVYGADLKIEGLSAYAIEVLVLGAGGFVKALEKITEMVWPIKRGDPVDKKRNVLASVSHESFNTVKEAARIYLKTPGNIFFFPNKPGMKLPTVENVAMFVMERPDLVEDAIWGIAKKKARKLVRNARVNGYEVVRKSVLVDDKIYLVFKVGSLKKLETIIKGPTTDRKLHAARFMDAHSGFYEENDVLYAREKSRFPTFNDLVEAFEKVESLDDKEIRQRFKNSGAEWKTWLVKFMMNKRPWEY